MSKSVFLAAGLCCAAASPAIAQSSTRQQSETIVVTATRTQQAARKVGSSISVISGANLQSTQAIVVSDALSMLPGVQVSRNGGVGGLTSIRIRGAESDQTVVLIDGIKLNDPSSPGGGFNAGNLLVGDLDRIEILRGPQSTLYGSQALGGVVNLITKSGDVGFGLSANLETGGLSTHRGQVNVRGRRDGFSYAASLGGYTTDGVSAFRAGSEKDGYQNTSAQARLGYWVNENLDFEGRAWFSRGRVDQDGFAPPTYAFGDTQEKANTDELILYAGTNFKLLYGHLNTRIGLSQTTTDRDFIDPAQKPDRTFIARGRNNRLDIQSVLDVNPNLQLVAGGEWEDAELTTRSPSNFDLNPAPFQANTKSTALYLQAQASPTDWLTGTLGMRWTDIDRFGDALNARATLAATFNDGNTIVRTAIADAFKAPTPYQLFSEYGNKRLVPEEGGSIEIGLEQAFWDKRVIAALTAFTRDTTNQIDFASCFGNPAPICVDRPFGVYDNVARTKAEGIETSIEVRPTARLILSGTYTNLDARNRARGSANFNRRLARRPQETGHVSVSYSFASGFDVSLTQSFAGSSFDNASNSVRLKGYDLLSVRVSQKLNDHWTIFGRVENAADETYEIVRNYSTLPRQAFVGLRAQF